MTDIEGALRRPRRRARRASPGGGLSQRARDAGLLDVAYAETDSPIGELIVFVTPRGLPCGSRVRRDRPQRPLLGALAPRLAPRPARSIANRRGTSTARGLLRASAPLLQCADRLVARARLRDWGPARDGEHPVWRRAHLRSDRGPCRLAPCGEGSGQRARLEPDPVVVPCLRAPRRRGLGGYLAASIASATCWRRGLARDATTRCDNGRVTLVRSRRAGPHPVGPLQRLRGNTPRLRINDHQIRREYPSSTTSALSRPKGPSRVPTWLPRAASWHEPQRPMSIGL
jgi:methylated-DNA-[protein]-cysteine S-methyltransferase